LSVAVFSGRRLALTFVALGLAGALVVGQAPPPTYAATTQAASVISWAKNQTGKPWSLGAIGMSKFDCSGLVYRTFYETGLIKKIGGTRRSAKGYWDWFRNRGLASRSNPRKGDLIVWGKGKHIGIYIGDGKAISTLSRGVKVHGVFAVTLTFTAYLHVNITR
jgi:peptidoglycan DL-endopeptidase CwlO